ncbi:MAG: hypothetical protein DMG04_01410 [Acidobacteria bacterium]|nr:MAG: hypothetical protein DMG04_01410 [Acidobacteriota bacterium]
MPTYVTLLNLTQKGVETIKQSPQRVEAAKQMAKSAGGEIKAVYYTMGQYDIVVISEAPDGSCRRTRSGGFSDDGAPLQRRVPSESRFASRR